MGGILWKRIKDTSVNFINVRESLGERTVKNLAYIKKICVWFTSNMSYTITV